MRKKSKKNNFFLLSLSFFFVWLTFFDSDDLITLGKCISKYYKLTSDRKYYTLKIKELKEYNHALANDDRALEKIAREKYYFKKPGEDIYIIK